MKFSLITSILAFSTVVYSNPVRRYPKVPNLAVPQSLQNLLDAQYSPAYKYPTDLTRDILPKPIHSHNDYWRDVPFYSALSVGCESIEADVFLVNDTLYIGHDNLALTPERTFDALYVQPLLSVLKRQNTPGSIAQQDTKSGVFDTAIGQTLYLWVDVKSDGAKTWPFVVQALEPLRKEGYLTSVDGNNITQNVVTVIGTGQAPKDVIKGAEKRDYFWDANLALLDTDQSDVTSSLSPIASCDFSRYVGPISGTTFNSTQLDTLRRHISIAKGKGIGARYWEQPMYPISTRNAVWQTLLQEGVALIVADDLQAAAGFSSSAGW